jgi:hypothetical protein
MTSFLIYILLFGIAEARKHHHVQHNTQAGFIANKLHGKEQGNFEGGLVRSTLGPSDDAWEHLDFVKSDSDEEQYLKDAPAGYNDL